MSTSQGRGSRPAVVQLEELRRAAAELWGFDPETWPEHGNAPLAIAAGIAMAVQEIERLRAHVDDLQSGMWINCVYCGHRFGPGGTTPVSMADALKVHAETCPKHPMSALKRERDEAADVLRAVRELLATPKVSP